MKSHERIKQTAEIFTPDFLVQEMLDQIPADTWIDPSKTWLEPSAGDGNFLEEIKARLLSHHDERHVLNNMIFSVELLDDNHFTLQKRLGYLFQDNGILIPNPNIWSEEEWSVWFKVSKIDPKTRELNAHSQYAGLKVYHDGDFIDLKDDEVFHHINHVCASALTYDMSFSRG